MLATTRKVLLPAKLKVIRLIMLTSSADLYDPNIILVNIRQNDIRHAQYVMRGDAVAIPTCWFLEGAQGCVPDLTMQEDPSDLGLPRRSPSGNGYQIRFFHMRGSRYYIVLEGLNCGILESWKIMLVWYCHSTADEPWNAVSSRGMLRVCSLNLNLILLCLKRHPLCCAVAARNLLLVLAKPPGRTK